MEKAFVLSIDELKSKFPLNSFYEENGKLYKVVEYIEPMTSINFASYPMVCFEEFELSDKNSIEEIKKIITEEEVYEVSNSFINPHPNEDDFKRNKAQKFDRIHKLICLYQKNKEGNENGDL